MAFDHRSYMAQKGNKPGSRLKLKDGTTYRIPGYSPAYTADVLAQLALEGGVEKYTNKKVSVGEVEVTGGNALLPGEAAAAFVRACVTGAPPADDKPAPVDETGQAAPPANGHKPASRIPAGAAK